MTEILKRRNKIFSGIFLICFISVIVNIIGVLSANILMIVSGQSIMLIMVFSYFFIEHHILKNKLFDDYSKDL